MAETVRDLLASHPADDRRNPGPRAADPDLRCLARSRGCDRGHAQCSGHRPRRPGGDRAAERAGDGHGLRHRRLRRHHRPLEPGLPGRGAGLLPVGSAGQGADRGRGRRGAGGRGGATAWCGRAAAGDLARPPGRLVRARRRGQRRRGGTVGCRERGRRGAGAAHLGHDLAPQDRAAAAAQPCRLGPAYPHDARADAGRPLPQRHAAVPHPRPDRGGDILALGRGLDLLHAGLQRAALLPLARGRPADLVHGRADHAPGDPAARRAQSRDPGQGETALHPLLLGLAAGAGDAGAGEDLRARR